MATIVGSKALSIVVETHRLQLMILGVEPKAHLILDKTAFDIETIAKTLAAVLTGAMRASIYVSGASGGGNYSSRKSEAQGKANAVVEFHDEIKPNKSLERIIGVGVVYGIFPELNGKPYLTPAVEQVRPAFKQAWKALLA